MKAVARGYSGLREISRSITCATTVDAASGSRCPITSRHRRHKPLQAALREALDRLSALDRDVFLMREVGGLNYLEISFACQLTTDAVRSRLHRARQQLRATLGGEQLRNHSGEQR